MKTNLELQLDVQNAIKWQPHLHTTQIGVTANNGIITLSGNVDSYTKKMEAENAAKSVLGVKAIVEKIEVDSKNLFKNDNEIAEEIIKIYRWNSKIPDDKIKIRVENGWIVLTGELNWNYQKEEAKNAIKNVVGIKGISNYISIKSNTINDLEKEVIEKQLKNSWALNSDDIKVKVSGTKVILNGSVGSLYQKEEAGKIAWNTPGIWELENNLEVEFKYLNNL